MRCNQIMRRGLAALALAFVALVILVVVSVSQFAGTPQAAPPAFTAVPERPPLACPGGT